MEKIIEFLKDKGKNILGFIIMSLGVCILGFLAYGFHGIFIALAIMFAFGCLLVGILLLLGLW